MAGLTAITSTITATVKPFNPYPNRYFHNKKNFFMKIIILKHNYLIYISVLLLSVVSLSQKALAEDTQNFTISVEATDFRLAIQQAE
ncbi:MAG: hypothetical protein LBF58_07800, partial [Deltaproteobacteria bacterium]|nr:hypothetical protein [Deltaproteobacteria bacterium]